MRDENKIDFGSIQIHKKVLADIALSAIQEIKEVSLAPRDVGGRFLSLLGQKDFSGIGVSIDKENQVSIEVRVRVKYGVNIPDIARQVQDAVRAAVEKTADITLKDVHVNVQSIERGQS